MKLNSQLSHMNELTVYISSILEGYFYASLTSSTYCVALCCLPGSPNAQKTSRSVKQLINCSVSSRDETCLAVGKGWRCRERRLAYGQESLRNITAHHSGKEMRHQCSDEKAEKKLAPRCHIRVSKVPRKKQEDIQDQGHKKADR